jgi:hypothetical protein
MHPLILHFHLIPLWTQSASSIAWFDHFHVKPPKPLQEEHLKSNQQVILKNDESITNTPLIKPYKIWRYFKQTNKKTLQNMKVWQTNKKTVNTRRALQII